MTGDPLFADGVDWGDIAVMGVKVLVAFGALLVATMFMIWFERKLISDMQHRIGPNVAGPWGLPASLRRRRQILLQGRPPAGQRRPARLPAGPLHLGGHRVRGVRDRARRRRVHRHWIFSE